MSGAAGMALGTLLAAAAAPPEDVPPAAGGRRKALVIGNEDYGDRSLPNTLRDISSVEELLSAGQWEVERLQDLPADKLIAAVAAFSAQLEPGDDVIFYYSGHGHMLGDRNALIGAGLSGGIVLVDNIALQLSHGGLRSGSSLLLIDACRNKAPQLKGADNADLPAGDGFVAQHEVALVTFAFAVQPAKFASPRDVTWKGISPFVAALLDVAVPNKEWNDIVLQFNKNLRKRTGGKQVVDQVGPPVEITFLRVSPPNEASSIVDGLCKRILECGEKRRNNRPCL